MESVRDWVQHLASTSSLFTTLELAFNAPVTAPLAIGDSCLVDEADGALPGAQVVADLFPTVGAIERISACGAFVVAAADAGGGDFTIKVAERDGSGIISTIAHSGTAAVVGSVERILTDGIDVVVIYQTTTGSVWTAECFTAATGASKWVNTTIMIAAGAPFDMAWDQDHVYIVSNDPNGQLIALNRTTGVLVYRYDHSAGFIALESIAVAGGSLLFVGGAASSFASGATLRGIVALTGADAVNEGGLGSSPLAWDLVQATPTGNTGVMATDGKRLFVGEGAAVQQRSMVDGSTVGSTFAPVAATIRGVTVDQDYVYANDGAVGVAFTKSGHAKVWQVIFGFGVDRRMVSDGTAVFFDRQRVARGNYGPIRFKKIDPTVATHVALRQVLTPVDVP